MIESHNTYTYPQCHQFNNEDEEEDEETYSVTCKEGFFSYHPVDTSLMARFKGLQKPANALLIPKYKDQLLLDLKSFVLGKLQQRTLEQREILDCFVFNMNDIENTTQACRNQVDTLRQTTKEAYPLLRKNMAIMAGVSREGEVDEDIEHPQESHEVDPLNSREKREVERVLKETLDKEKAAYNTRFHEKYNCPSPEQLKLTPGRKSKSLLSSKVSRFSLAPYATI